MTRKQIGFIIATVIVVLVITFYLLTRKPVADKIKEAAKNGIWPMQLGYQGEIVKDIQNKLNRIFHGANLIVDGKIGPATQKYLKQAGYYPLTEEGYQEITIMAS